MTISATAKTTLTFLGYACELGTPCRGTAAGPQHFIQSQPFQRLRPLISHIDCFTPNAAAQGLEATTLLQEINTHLATKTEGLTRQGQPFVTVGGDHSSAIGTWSGVSTGLSDQGDLGLIWFDAHMDSHTPESTHTGNIHGMPLAVLLGYGDPVLTALHSPRPKIKGEHLCLIGIRSFEPEEEALLKSLNVRIFFMQEIQERGIKAIFAEALAIATTGTAGFGISFDLDVIDPTEAPGVGTPAPRGLLSAPLITALQAWNHHPQLLGLEIAEFTPILDIEGRTETIIAEIIEAIWGTGEGNDERQRND